MEEAGNNMEQYGIEILTFETKQLDLPDENRTDFYAYVRSLDALKASMTGEDKTVILSEDHPLHRFLPGNNEAAGNRA